MLPSFERGYFRADYKRAIAKLSSEERRHRRQQDSAVVLRQFKTWFDKPSVRGGRKNWLFSDSQSGATASANLYSVLETVRAIELNDYAYLNHVLTELPAHKGQPEDSLFKSAFREIADVQKLSRLPQSSGWFGGTGVVRGIRRQRVVKIGWDGRLISQVAYV